MKNVVFSITESATREVTDSSRKVAFTLAEVLITLGIIGVVAAVSLPTVLNNINERRNSEREANIAQKMTQAMEHMRAMGKLTPYATTEDFIAELKNHIKINKICYKDNLTDCWPTKTIIDGSGDEYEVSNAKTGKALGKTSTTNNVGLILADGASIILNYDNRTEGYDVGARITGMNEDLPVGGGKKKSFPYTTDVTDSISFVMDINGKNKPNKEMDSNGKYYDIRSFRNARFSYDIPWQDGDAGKIIYFGTISESQAVDCRSSNSTSSDYQKYCGPHPSPYEFDYWAGAKKICAEQTHGQGSLPTASKLHEIYNKKSQYSSLSSTTVSFWSSEEDFVSGFPNDRAINVRFTHADDIDSNLKGITKFHVVCTAN